MSIVSYEDLLVKIPQWAERVDLPTDLIQDFIYMAEAECSQLLRVPAMENAEQITVTNGRIKIPFDFMELRRLTHESEDNVLQYLAWDQYVQVNTQGGVYQETQTPQFYSRQGTNWFISPEPADGSVILCHYYRYIPALSNDIDSNWLLKFSPQAYLYGGLKYLFEYVMDQDRAAYWEKKFLAEVTKLQQIADSAEHRGTHLAVRTLN